MDAYVLWVAQNWETPTYGWIYRELCRFKPCYLSLSSMYFVKDIAYCWEVYERAAARVADTMRNSGVSPSAAVWTAATEDVAKSIYAKHELSPAPPAASPTPPDVLDKVIHKLWNFEDVTQQGPVDWNRHFDEAYATLSPHLDAMCVDHSPLSYSSLCRELQREDLEEQAELWLFSVLHLVSQILWCCW